MARHNKGKTIRRGFWAVSLFYLLIAFEFFYMASPFAVYFYSVYRPALNVLSGLPGFSQLARFFLPHIVVETSSPLIDLHNAVGIILAVGGLFSFLIGAGHVYYHKLTKRGAVIGGVYRYIRHPQYLSLAVSGLGLVLLWPRYIVLVTYVTMLFVYRGLARIEERECIERFGKPYQDYMRRTGMFFPFRLPFLTKLWPHPRSKGSRIALVSAAYLLALVLSLGTAEAVRRLSVASLCAAYTNDSATISLVRMDGADLKKIVELALGDERVGARLGLDETSPAVTHMNYVLPAGLFVSEIPMSGAGTDDGHHFLSSGDRGPVWRIVFTRAIMRKGSRAEGADIILATTGTVPQAEVLVDLERGTVVRVDDPAPVDRYEKVPMPVF